MDELQHLQTRRHDSKTSVTKLLNIVEDLGSTDLESVNSQSIKEVMRLAAEVTLSQLKAKEGQIGELDSTIAEKITIEDEY